MRESILVTKKMLSSVLHACSTGVKEVGRFLPARLYVDPEKNLPLTIAMANAGKAYRVDWLVAHSLVPWHDRWPDDIAEDSYSDPYRLAQTLGMVADRVLSKASPFDLVP